MNNKTDCGAEKSASEIYNTEKSVKEKGEKTMEKIKIKSLQGEEQSAGNTAITEMPEESVPSEQEENKVKWSDPAILKEDEEKADAHSRHFVMNNGTTKSVICASPVNFYDENKKKWRKIDNSLEEREDGYEAKFGKYKAKLSKAEDGTGVKISGDGKEVAWEYLGTKKPDGITARAAKAKKKASVLKVKKAVNAYSDYSTGSEAEYEGIEENTTLQYVLNGNNLKENIIVKEKAEEYKYYFALKTEGLLLRLSEDGKSIELYSESDGKTEFTIPGPYMYDMDGNRSDSVYFDLEQDKDGSFIFAVIADSEWINDENRALPVTIDPQINVTDNSVFLFVRQLWDIDSNGNESIYNGYVLSNTSALISRSSNQMNDLYVCIYGDQLNIDRDQIISAKLKLYVESGSGTLKSTNIGGKTFTCTAGDTITLDVFSNIFGYIGEAGSFTITPINNCSMQISLGGDYPPVLELELLGNEKAKSVYKSFNLAGGVSGDMDINTGEFVPGFTDVDESGSLLGTAVAHVYKKDLKDFNAGKNFRLNLHEKFEKNNNSALDANYVYTDGSGIKHGFKDLYYYLDDNNEKVYVEKYNINIDLDQTLSFTAANGTIYPIYKEQITSSGLKAITQLDDFKNCDLLEQRNEDYKQVEEQIEAYEQAFKDYVIINSINNEVYFCEDYMGKNKVIGDFLNYLNSSDNYLLTKSEKINYLSLLLQKKSLTEQKESIAYQQTSLNNQSTALTYSSSSIAFQIQTMNNTKELSASNPEHINTYKSIVAQNNINKNIITNLGHQQTNISQQKNDLVNSISLLNKEKNNLNDQLNIITEQINELKGKTAVYKEQLQKYNKEYRNLLHKFTYYKQQIPVNYLTDGSIIKGYNESGDLVVIFDSYQNAVAIEYEDYDLSDSVEKYRIAYLYDENDNRVTFEYNNDNLLTSIKDIRGRKTKYSYNSNSQLERVDFASGKYITFTYDSNDNIVSVCSSDKLESDITYESNKLKALKTYSLASYVKHGECGETEKSENNLLEDWSITYNSSLTQIAKDDDIKEYYSFNSYRNNSQYVLEEYGKVTRAEKYYYSEYAKEKTEYAKKDTLNLTPYSSFSFTASNYEETLLNDFNKPATTTKYSYISEDNTITSVSTYSYDKDNVNCEKVTTVTTHVMPNETKSYTSVITYSYNAQGKVVRTESYVEGEELTNGKNIEETIYDEKGNAVKSFAYNSLDSSSKFYTESKYSEKGKLTAAMDETGENTTEYEYVDGTNIVKTAKLSNGGKFSYGYDIEDNVTSITQSTEEGEESSTQTSYTCGLVTELVSGNNKVQYEYDNKRRLKAVHLNGTENYETYEYIGQYDDDGVRVTNAKGELFISTVDNSGKPHWEFFTSTLTPDLTYYYDEYGRVVRIEDVFNNLEETFEYDTLGRETKYNAPYYNREISYDDYGTESSKKISFNDSNSTEFTYSYFYTDDSQRRLKGMSVGDYAESYEVDCLGRNKKTTQTFNGNNYTTRYGYYKVGDHATNKVNTVYYGRNGVTNGKITYTYDGMGNIISVNENGKQKHAYTYDSLGRLINEKNLYKYEEISYTYDNNGNILTKTVNGVTYEYKYEEGTDRLISYNFEPCEYDEIGNPCPYCGMTLGWTRGGRLETIVKGWTTVTYGYDVYGKRTGKMVDGVQTKYLYEEGKLIKEYTDTDYIYYIYGKDGIIGIKTKDKSYMFRKNIFGDVEEIYDENGNLVGKYGYTAFGKCSIELDMDGIATINHIRYRSYYYDTETELYYLNTRYYDPETGRFIGIDNVKYADPNTINGLNLYAYCGNNPVMFTDPNGCLPQWIGWLVTGIILVGLAVATVLTFGAAAPITGLAATMVVGAMIGATVGFGASIITQGVVNGWDNINSWQVLTDTTIGAIGGALTGAASTSASIGIRLGLKGARIALGGIGAAVNGLIEGQSASAILKSVALSISVGIVLQGAGTISDGIAGKLNPSVVDLMRIDGAFAFGAKQILTMVSATIFKTIWKYVQIPLKNGVKSIIG